MPAISIKNINKTYIDQDGNEVQALHDINLDVAEGEFVCIVGPINEDRNFCQQRD